MTPYRIRRVDEAASDIADTLEELHKLTFVDGTHMPVTDGEWPGDWWLAYFKGAPVAFAGIVKSIVPNAAYLCRVGVLAAHRGNRLQQRFIRVAERRAVKLGFGWMVSDTTNNPPSANSFIACGYQTYAPKEPWSFPNAIYWRKQL
jgi:GNAT superfamily N-acetyltransferase